MHFISRHQEVTAFEVAPVVNGVPTEERRFVVDGIGVIDRETFLSLYQPREVAKPVRVAAAPKKAPAKKKAAPRPKPVANDDDDIPSVAVAPKKPSMSELIRSALAEKPRLEPELLRLLLDAGFDTDSRRLTQNLTYMRMQNQIYKGADYRWNLAQSGKAMVAGE